MGIVFIGSAAHFAAHDVYLQAKAVTKIYREDTGRYLNNCRQIANACTNACTYS